MALSAPFHRWLGFRGLRVVPLLGLWVVWIAMVRLLRRLGASPGAVAVGTGGLAFASFATPYGAMYWEHAPALGLSCAGLALALPAASSRTDSARSLCAGLLLGAAVWMRPESLWFGAGVCLVLPLLGAKTRTCAAVCIGLAAAALLFAAFNLWLYGHPLGTHAIQQIEATTLHVPHQSAPEIGGFVVRELGSRPVVAAVVLLTLVGVVTRSIPFGRTHAALWGIVAISCVGPVLVVPHAGGDQIGARYFLHSLPPLFALLALLWDGVSGLRTATRKAVRTALLLALAVGFHLDTVRGSAELYDAFHRRFLPALEALRADPSSVVAVEHQWIAQALEAELGNKAFFRVKDAEGLDRLARAVIERDLPGFLLLRFQGSGRYVREAEGFRMEVSSRARHGFVVFEDVTVVPAGARGSAEAGIVR